MLNIRRKAAVFVRDKDGSDTVEMVATTTMLVAFILVAFLFFAYIFEVELCASATRRVVRDVEVAGVIDPDKINESFKKYLTGSDEVLRKKEAKVIRATLIDGTNHIQLEDTFTSMGSCEYRLRLINPGSYEEGFCVYIPINTEQRGMSEVFWLKGSGGRVKATK